MLSVAKRVESSMLVANARHARSDAASLVVGIGIVGNLAGYPNPRPDRRARRRLHGRQDGVELCMGCDARSYGPRGRRPRSRVYPGHIDRDARRSCRTRHPHPQDGRHDRGRCASRSRCRDDGRSRAPHCRVRLRARDATPPRAQPDDAPRSLAQARSGPCVQLSARFRSRLAAPIAVQTRQPTTACHRRSPLPRKRRPSGSSRCSPSGPHSDPRRSWSRRSSQGCRRAAHWQCP